MQGRFCYNHPGEMKAVTHELFYGYLTHYAIGIALALIYVLGWKVIAVGPVSPGWAVVFGVATTAASWFLVFPSMGFGACGLRSPDGIRSSVSSLANHLFFGTGMAIALALL